MFLGIDIGTTNTKALLLTEQLQVVADGAISYPLYTAKDTVEQDPKDWWNAVCTILQGFWASGLSAKDIKCVCVSGHGCSLVVMDQDGRLLRPAISSLDNRSIRYTEQIRKNAGDLILQYNGNAVGNFNFDPKLLWLKESEPHHYHAMHRMMSATGYINYKLTGEWKGNLSDFGISLAHDRLNGGRWNTDIIKAMGLDPEKYPDLWDCSAVIGTVHAKASAETGLCMDTPVLAGGEDTSSAAFAMGVSHPGMAYLSMGTQCTVGICTDRYAVLPKLMGFPHVLPEMQLINGSMSTCGAGISWFIHEFCKDLQDREAAGGKSALSAFNEICETAEPGAKGLIFLPYLSGELHPILDAQAAGMFFGLRLEHTRAEMGRAVLEGIAHATAHNLFYAKSIAPDIPELRASGGPANSPVLCQAIADITGIPVKTLSFQDQAGGAPLGNALLAMYAEKVNEDMTAEERFVSFDRTYEPNVQHEEMYRHYHALYQQLYEQNRPLLHELHTIKSFFREEA